MEDEKAAAYYDELVRKGGNAAKYKQGLGFGGSQPSLSKSEGYGSLSNFVKSSPGRTAALEKEGRLDSIRDKLKKKEDDDTSRKRSSERNRKKDHDLEDDGGHMRRRRRRRRRRTPELQMEDKKREPSSRHSLSSEDSGREVVKKSGSDKKRSRSVSRGMNSMSPKHRVRSETPEEEPTAKRRELEQRVSRSPSRGSSGTSSERNKGRGRLLRKDRSRSPGDDSRSRHRRSPETRSRRSRSRSRSVERRRDRSSRGREADRRSFYRRNSSYSPRRSRRRERSRSPASHRSYRDRDYRNGGRVFERSNRKRPDINRRRYEGEKRGGRSYRDRDRGPEENSRSAQEKIQELDYSKLIPNFESMTPAEKVKAKMKLQLSETVVKDKAMGMSDEWERFDFNKDAPLDDDAKQDYFGDGTGANDDTEFLKNSGSTFVSSTNQVTREAQVQSVHDNAIFGPPQGMRIIVSNPELHPLVERNSYDDDTAEQPIIVEEADVSRKEESPQEAYMESAHPVSSVVSQQVIAMQQAGSWQERARKMREARAALDS